MTHANQKRLIKEAEATLWTTFGSIGYKDLQQLTATVLREEKCHRGGRSGIPISLPASASLMVSRGIMQCRTGDHKRPPVEFALDWRTSVFQSWAFWARHKIAVRKAFPMAYSREWLDTVDYVELMRAKDA